MSGLPLNYLSAAGERADIILPLTWFTLLVSIAVCLIIGVLLWLGVRRALHHGGAEQTRAVPVERGAPGSRWISVGLMLTAVPLLITLVWTVVALAKISGPPANTALTLDISAHQWWWEVRYDADEPSQIFATANEIHIPVGPRVLVRLHGDDVIHSFWIPQLSGKTDMIPGQNNVSWLQAAAPGRYQGTCSEYCGFQHAKMRVEVVADRPAQFEQWRAHQLTDAAAPQSDSQRRGLQLFEYRCGLCHEARGTRAGAISGPDLTHIASRRTLAAGTLLNTPANLARWIQSPQQFKPGALMPDQDLSPDQLEDVVAYMAQLQ